MARILIAGAGPAGLVAARHCADAGFQVTIFEAEPDIPETLRGSTFHPSSLDMLESAFGAATPLIQRGLVAPTVQYRRHGIGRIAEFDFADIDDLVQHPYRLQAEQYKLCQILHEQLQRFPNVRIRFSTPVTEVTQTATSVTVSGPDFTESGDFLIGADGANSAVRRCLDVAFDGFTWPERFLVVSTPFDFKSAMPDLASVTYVADAEQWYFLLQVPELWRVMFPTDPDEADEDVLAEAAIQQRLNRVLANETPYAIAHKTLYKVHQRVAERYRIGRVLLTGDAAHINNPLGGMGMNGGIHDSFNLAEKLIAVVRDGADMSLLDRYNEERRAVALEYVQKVSIQNKKDLETADPGEQRAFERRLRDAEQDAAARRALLLRLSMLASLGVSG